MRLQLECESHLCIMGGLLQEPAEGRRSCISNKPAPADSMLFICRSHLDPQEVRQYDHIAHNALAFSERVGSIGVFGKQF